MVIVNIFMDASFVFLAGLFSEGLCTVRPQSVRRHSGLLPSVSGTRSIRHHSKVLFIQGLYHYIYLKMSISGKHVEHGSWPINYDQIVKLCLVLFSII